MSKIINFNEKQGKKLFTNKQYKEYCSYMDKIANEDDIQKNYAIYCEYKEWLLNNNINKFTEKQMEEKLEKDFNL